MSVRRRIVLLMVCLVLGAVVNVSVAWGCCLWAQPSMAAGNVDVAHEVAAAKWKRYARPGWPETPNDMWMQAAAAARSITLSTYRSDGSTYAMVIFGSGWPYPALEGVLTSDPLTRSGRNVLRLQFDMPWTSVKLLPIAPIFPGFLLNLLLYAALVWLLIRIPSEARRRWREHKNRCGACGYPRGLSPVCTECGADLSHAWFRGVASDAAQ